MKSEVVSEGVCANLGSAKSLVILYLYMWAISMTNGNYNIYLCLYMRVFKYKDKREVSKL